MKKLVFVLTAVFGLCLTACACSGSDGQGETPATDGGAVMCGKTLIVYYSFTNNSHVIATELQAQTGADILRVEPADENVDYNDYSIGLPMMNLIKEHPDDPASYPAIKTTIDNLADYDVILIVAPLWWNSMAAPLQTFLYRYGGEMAGRSIGLAVSSGESGISGVEADVRRLIPDGRHAEPSLWILRSQTDRCGELIRQWLRDIHYGETASVPSAYASPLIRLSLSDGILRAAGALRSLSVYDMRGCRLMRTSSTALPVAPLPAGTYMVRAEGEHETVSRKMLLP